MKPLPILGAWCLGLLLAAGASAWAQPSISPTSIAGPRKPPAEAKGAESKASESKSSESTPPKESLADQVRAILEKEKNAKPSVVRRNAKPAPAAPIPVITVEVNKRGTANVHLGRRTADPGDAPPVDPKLGLQYRRARAMALTGQIPAAYAAPGANGGRGMITELAPHSAAAPAHWDYGGENGPQAWSRLNPDFKLCTEGKRQSPIHIEGGATLLGPAEPLQFNYRPSGGSVVNNGHTLQVDVEGENTLTVRGSTYKLVQFHFHHPAEEKIDQKGFAMVAHLVHRNAENQLAVVAVLMDPGAASPLINNVWTYLPLEVSDRVRVPAGMIDLNTLLPQDQRYYQFMGSLTTPPCSEGVLWMVLKSPVTLSEDQLKLFAQLFPNNARPVQALNGRVVREAQ